MGNRLSVTIISSLTADEDSIPQQIQPAQSSVPAMPPVWTQPQDVSPKIDIEPEPTPVEASQPVEAIPIEEPAPPPVPNKPEPRLLTPPTKPVPIKEEKPSPEKNAPAKQEVLQFEPVTRGRFEKSEPTIVEGEDLDVPTYLRKNIKVK
jgi:cell division protein FtsZ